MGNNDFNQYSRASQRLFANLVFHLLSGAPSDVQRTVQPAVVSSSRRLAETTAGWTVRCTFLPVDSGLTTYGAPFPAVFSQIQSAHLTYRARLSLNYHGKCLR